MVERRLAALAATLALVAGLLPAVVGIAAAATTPVATYNAVPAVLPGNVPSQAFEATSTSEFGDLVRLAPGPRQAASLDVVMSSWGCETGGWTTGDCVTTPGNTFSHPITLNIYAVNGSGQPTGAPIVSVTESFAIPYRPSADLVNCTGGRWYSTADAACYNGYATTITFDLAGTTLPSELIWTVAYNTSDYGAAPIGTAACSPNCGYDSLNVGAESFAGQPSSGTDLDPDGAVLDSDWAGAYCDGGAGGTGTLRLDTGAGCWTDYRPLATIRTRAENLTQTTVVVNEANQHGWTFVDDNGSGSALGHFVAGPATPPLGSGSAQLATTASVDGQMLATPAFAGSPLERLTTMDYSSWQSGPTLALALQFDVRYHPSDVGYQGRLVFEPYQTVGAVGSGWQAWSPLTGKWWASKTTAAGSNGLCPQSSPCAWAQVLANWPDASILGNTLFKAGSGWSSFTGSVDAFRIGVDDGAGNITETTYDFEHVDLLGPCIVTIAGTTPVTYTLQADCITDHTVVVPQNTGGTLFDGNGHTITGVDPAGGHFLGAVVQAAAGPKPVTVTDLTVTVSGLSNVCDEGTGRLRGILFDAVGGSITNNTVTGIKQGTGSGCQEGNAIEARNAPFAKGGADLKVTISGNVITDYQKTGIVASGSVAATITSNVVTGVGPVNYIAQNGIQVGFGATAIVKGNTASGNSYTPSSYVSCGFLIYQADGVKASSNTLFDNERNQCNFGKGGGTFNPTP